HFRMSTMKKPPVPRCARGERNSGSGRLEAGLHILESTLGLRDRVEDAIDEFLGSIAFFDEGEEVFPDISFGMGSGEEDDLELVLGFMHLFAEMPHQARARD